MLAVLVGCVAALAGTASSAAAGSLTAPGEVLVVSLPGLTWSDVAAMPTLNALLARGSVGSLTGKAGGTTTRCLAGALTFSAGNRALPAGTGCTLPAGPGGWAQLRHVNRHSQYDADIGALGSTLQAAGVGTVADSAPARPMLVGRDGVLGPATGRSGSRVVAVVDTSLYPAAVASGTPSRAAAQHAADQALRRALTGLAPGSMVIVTSTSDAATGPASLHPLVIAGPGWSHHELRFAGAQAPYAETIDLAPTILHALGLPVPATMVGTPLQVSGSAVRPVSSYLDDDRHARADALVQAPLLLVLGWMTILVIILAAAGRSEVRLPARLLAPLPLVTFGVNLLPWWRWDRAVYAVVLSAGCVVIAIGTTLLARRRPHAAVVAVPLASLVVLAIDQLAGTPLQLSAPLGFDPIDAGRFAGMGNLDFAVVAAAAVVVASLVGNRLPRRQGLLLAAAVMLVAVIVDAAPPLGDDAGGLLALVPTSVVVIAVLAGVRLSARRIAAVLGGTAAVAVAVALADYSRPASSQTHIGQFVGQLLHGGAGTEVGRKAHAALATVGLTISSAVVVVAIVAALLRRHRIEATVATDAGLLALLAGGVTVAVLGSALNDSGLNVAAMVLTVAVGALCSGQWPIRTPVRQEATNSPPATTMTSRTSATDRPDSPGR